MIRFLFPLLIILAMYLWARHYLKTAPPELVRTRKINVVLMTIVTAVLLLAATGKMHWLGAAIAALIPIGRFLLQPAVLGLLQRLHQHRAQGGSQQRTQDEGGEQSHNHDNNRHQSPSATSMQVEEARKILGLNGHFNRDDVIQAHRKLMQKVHPDHGGNDFLAAQLNAAKEVLLAEFEQKH